MITHVLSAPVKVLYRERVPSPLIFHQPLTLDSPVAGVRGAPRGCERLVGVTSFSNVRASRFGGGSGKVSPIFLVLLAAVVAGALLCAFASNQFLLELGAILVVFVGWVVSLCLHEFGHAVTAYRGGDWAVRNKGYLNLDPRRYTDPAFSIVLPLLFLAIGGIPLPGGAVWINHHVLRNRRVESVVSLAGPLTNLVLGAILTVVVTLAFPNSPIGLPNALGSVLTFLALLQILAFIINILPIPGLDGWGALEPWLPFSAQQLGARVRPWAPLGLFLILFLVPGAIGALYWVVQEILTALGGNGLAASFGQALAMPWMR